MFFPVKISFGMYPVIKYYDLIPLLSVAIEVVNLAELFAVFSITENERVDNQKKKPRISLYRCSSCKDLNPN